MLTRRALGLTPLAAPVLAQPGFPNRPIRLVVPWLPGGATDTPLRVLAELAGRQLGQPVLVENRPGASGTLGAAMMAQETRGDGYLVGQIPATVFRLPAMSRRPTYDPMVDFSWIIHLTGYVFGIVVRQDSPWNSFEEFLAHARANPGAVTYGTAGVGSTAHITTERIGRETGVEFLHVPFRGGPDVVQALLGGNIDAVADGTGWAQLVQEGRFRLLVVWTQERVRRFPDVRTLRECGIDVVSESPFGLAGPKAMDPGVVRVLHDAFKVALYDPMLVAALDRFDMPVRYMDSETYAVFARQQNAEETAAVRALGLRMD